MDQHPLLFVPESPLMLRTPLLPIEAILPLLTTSWESRQCWQDDLELTNAFTQDLDALHQWLLFLTEKSPFASVIREALFMGGPDIAHALPRLRDADISRKQTQKLMINVFRYLLRMTLRSTPFGLFAGVTTGQAGQETHVHLDTMQTYHTRTRVDMQWLFALIRQIEQNQQYIDHLRWTPNPLLWRSGTRIFLPYSHDHEDEQAHTVSFRATPLVLAILEMAHEGKTRFDLKRQLAVAYSDQPEMTSTLYQLCKADILVSELRPPLTHADPLAYLLDHLPMSSILLDASLSETIQKVITSCAAYDQLPPGQGEALLHTMLQQAYVPHLPPLRIATDLSITSASATLSSQVLNDCALAAQLLLRLSPHPAFPIDLQRYHTLFIEKYGIMRQIPVLELLDEFSGLGPPPGYQYPARTSPLFLPAQHDLPEREYMLFTLASSALYHRQHELCLNDDHLSALQGSDQWQAHLPDSLDLFFSLAAPSQEAIDQGDYLLCIGSRVGAAPAGRSFGRFCDILGEETNAMLQRLAREEEQREPEKLFAELVYLPPRGHAANVALRPGIRSYEIVIATSARVAAEQVLALENLVVGVTSERFYLWSLTHEKEVVLCNTHLLNLSHQTPNIVRFLAAIAGRHAPQVHPFDWGKCEALAFLPRLRYGRIVLSLARWRFPLEEIHMQQTLFDQPTRWYQFIQQWRETWRVPRYVHLVSHDQTLLLDLENPLSCLDLLDTCRQNQKQDAPIFQEVLPDLEHAWVTGEQGHMLSEWIVVLKRQTIIPVRPLPIHLVRSKLSPITPAQRVRLLGSDWVYVKLYCREEVQQELLIGPLQLYLRNMTQQQPGLILQWFFVRYHDPLPHLRLRIQCNPVFLCSHLLPSLLGWLHVLTAQGWISQAVFDTYEREIERYGGLEAMSFAEACFARDSDFVLALLTFLHQQIKNLTEDEDISLMDIMVLSIETLLGGLGLNSQQRYDLYTQIISTKASLSLREKYARHYHGYQKRLQRLIGNRVWRLQQPGGQQLELLIEHAMSQSIPLRTPLAQVPQECRLHSLSSLVHMHCNRLLANREQEDEAMYYLWRLFEGFSRYVPSDIVLE